MIVLIPFVVGPFLTLGYSVVYYLSENRMRFTMLFSLGSITYFCFAYLIWSVTEITKHRRANTVQDMSQVAERKKLHLIKKKEYGGVLAYFNPSFFPR